jgi:hypothetical protein
MVNHVPMVTMALIIGLLAWAVARRQESIGRATLVALVLVALATAAVYLTGEAAEEVVETLPGVSENLIERHEEVAAIAVWSVGGLGAVALLGLVAFRRPRVIPRWFLGGALAMSIGAAAIVAWAANLGGQIRHPEVRPDFRVDRVDSGHDASEERER